MILYYKISTSVYALLIHNSLIYGSKLHYLPLAQNQNNQSLVRFQKKSNRLEWLSYRKILGNTGDFTLVPLMPVV